MDQTPETVYKVVLSLTNFILRYAVVLAAIGALSMALIEAVKALMSWRDRFHQRMVIEWVKTGPMLMPPETRSSDDELRSRVYTDMIRLTTAVDGAAMSSGIAWAPWRLSAAHALFALDLPKMMGQIQEYGPLPGTPGRLDPQPIPGARHGDYWGHSGKPPAKTAADRVGEFLREEFRGSTAAPRGIASRPACAAARPASAEPREVSFARDIQAG